MAIDGTKSYGKRYDGQLKKTQWSTILEEDQKMLNYRSRKKDDRPQNVPRSYRI